MNINKHDTLVAVEGQETQRIDLLELSDQEKIKVLEQVKAYLQQRVAKAKGL